MPGGFIQNSVLIRQRLWYSMLAVALLFCLQGLSVYAQGITNPPEVPAIKISASYSTQWQQERETIYELRGHCQITQGANRYQAEKMVLWHQHARGNAGVHKIAVYLEGNVRLDAPASTHSSGSIYLELEPTKSVIFDLRHAPLKPAGDQPAQFGHDALYSRAFARKQASTRKVLHPTQYVVPRLTQNQFGQNGPALPGVPPLPDLQSVQIPPADAGTRRIRIFPRSGVPYNVESFGSNNTVPPEQVWVLTGGINILIDGVAEFGTIDLSADRMVIWTRSDQAEEFRSETLQNNNVPLQIYLEGNIVVRQGQNTAYAERGYYDARENRGLFYNTELKTYVPQLQGYLRVRAQRLRQLSRDRFHAQNAWTSASQMGKPGYRFQASNIYIEPRVVSPWIGGGDPQIDPMTGMPQPVVTPWVTSLDNTFYLQDLPLFYFPRISGPAEDPNIPITSASVGSNRIFGQYIRTEWDLKQILGVDGAENLEWLGQLDFLSDRGPGVGTTLNYQADNLFGLPGRSRGRGLLYYQHDDGEDNLGFDRRALIPEFNNRGRALWRHRWDLPYDMTFLGELGFVSDRNFLEQFYEPEFDTGKDQETSGYLKQDLDNWSWDLFLSGRVNDFEYQTQWLPKANLFVLNEPLLNGWLNWSMRSTAGYAQSNLADAPTDPNDLFSPIPFFADANAGVFSTRHEINTKLNLGALQIVPYAMAEAAYWSESFTADDVDRLVGEAGVRSSLSMWRIYPHVHNNIFGLNGLAHKIRFNAEYAFTDSSESIDNIAQFNEFDDDAQERFRERLLVNTFGGTLPAIVEPRRFAIRTGAANSVTAPYNELIDDLQVLRFGMQHRLQTKVGPPEQTRIKDWMIFDVGAAYFPDAVDDNFGESFGLINGRYRWNLSDRTSVLASALYDIFDDGQEIWNVGVLSQRSLRGSIYVGVRQLRGGGVLDSEILTASYSYVMGPKWISTFGTAFDLAENENRGQSLTITRVGADFLIHVGANFDAGKNNAGIGISVEPKLGPFNASSTQLSSLLGVQ